MKKRLLITLSIILSILLCTAPINAEVAHDSWPGIPVTEKNQVVDSITVNGVTVNAYFSPKVEGEYYYYQCTELVNRFYEEVYGLKNATWTNVRDKYFVKTTNPSVGDWQYSDGHSAIVKRVYKDKNGKVWVVTIDQNYWANNGNAMWERRVTLDEAGITYYRYINNYSLASVEAFVTRLYNLCLSRNPDKSGLSYWINKLISGSSSAAEVVKGFLDSNEMKNKNLSDEDFLEICYLSMMDRKSDAGGKKYWLEKLTNGMSRNYVLKGFVESNEFNNICNNYGVSKGTITLTEARDSNSFLTSFVVRCYLETLGRKYDVGGLNYWCNALLSSSNRRETALSVASDGFFHSKEFINKNLDDEEFLKVLYRTFLNRNFDRNGLDYWLDKLANGMSRDEVMYGFAYSKEFKELLAKYGL